MDEAYDSYRNEIALAKKRIFVNSDVTKVDARTGSMQPIFDNNDVVFYAFPMGNDSSKPITESDLTIQAQEHEMALQMQLNLLSAKCGFGQDYYQFNGDAVKTATEVISENSQLYRRVKKDEILLERVLIDMVRALLLAGGVRYDGDVSVHFDDSIIEDQQAIANRALLEYNAGLIDKVEYYIRVYGHTEKQAQELADKIASRSPAPADASFFAGGDG